MKTKFILSGGYDANSAKENNDFYEEILTDAPVASKVLLVFFAKDEEKIPAAVERVKSEFNANKKDKNLSFEIATKDNLLEQIKAADIVYFSGGHTTKLIEDLKQFPHLTEALKGKIVAGESAGANAWSVFCYSPKADKILEGLGVLPIKLIPHYEEKYKGLLDSVGTDLELVLLANFQTRVFVIDLI